MRYSEKNVGKKARVIDKGHPLEGQTVTLLRRNAIETHKRHYMKGYDVESLSGRLGWVEAEGLRLLQRRR